MKKQFSMTEYIDKLNAELIQVLNATERDRKKAQTYSMVEYYLDNGYTQDEIINIFGGFYDRPENADCVTAYLWEMWLAEYFGIEEDEEETV